MNKNDFMNQLVTQLDGLPTEERHAAINYYEEYFEEAGVEHEEEAICNLGSPKRIAKQILEDFAIKEEEKIIMMKADNRSSSTIGMVILGILTAPITLPLAIGLVVILIAGIIATIAIIMAIGITAIGLMLSGISMVIESLAMIIGHPPTAIFTFGLGVIFIGGALFIGLLIYYVVIKLVPYLIRSIDSMINHKIKAVRS